MNVKDIVDNLNANSMDVELNGAWPSHMIFGIVDESSSEVVKMSYFFGSGPTSVRGYKDYTVDMFGIHMFVPSKQIMLYLQELLEEETVDFEVEGQYAVTDLFQPDDNDLHELSEERNEEKGQGILKGTIVLRDGLYDPIERKGQIYTLVSPKVIEEKSLIPERFKYRVSQKPEPTSPK